MSSRSGDQEMAAHDENVRSRNERGSKGRKAWAGRTRPSRRAQAVIRIMRMAPDQDVDVDETTRSVIGFTHPYSPGRVVHAGSFRTPPAATDPGQAHLHAVDDRWSTDRS